MEHSLIINQSNIRELSSFNTDYSSIAFSLCPLLKKFQIIIVNDFDTIYANEAKLTNIDTFSFYMNKTGDDASTTYAEIIVNKTLCTKLGLTSTEMMAGIAHEIGHIIMFFRTDKDFHKGLSEEIYSDYYACKMGLTGALMSLLQKLIDSNLYSELQVYYLRQRITNIKMLNYDIH